MPIYQYQCGECHHQLEALQKMSDPKLVDCPECGASALQKQVTAARFKLKGTGWYETDFKNSGKPPAATSTSNDDSKKGENKSAESVSSSADSSASNEKPSASAKSSDAAA